METNQQLTTEQVALLILINDIENLMRVETHGNTDMRFQIKSVIDSIQTVDEDTPQYSDDLEFMTEDEWRYHLEVLKYYGYLKENYYLSIDGKQYLSLFKDYLQAKVKTPSIIINNRYSLLDIEKVAINTGLNINTELNTGINNSNIFGNLLKFIKIF